MAPPPPAVVEIDFLGLGPPSSARGLQYPNQNLGVVSRGGGGGGGGSSIRDIQKAVSRMDPDVLRSLITAAPGPDARLPQLRHHNSSTSITRTDSTTVSPAAPIQGPNPMKNVAAQRSPFPSATDTPAAAAATVLPQARLPTQPHRHIAPLTIFYDGSVSVFDVPPQVADLIIKTAETSSSLAAAATTMSSERAMAETLVADAPLSGLPLARKKSLRRFLEKRQLRLTSAAPYATPTSASSSSTAAGDGEVVLLLAAVSEDQRTDANEWAVMPDARRPWPHHVRRPVGRISRTNSSNSTTSGGGGGGSFSAIAGASQVTGAW